MKPRVRSSAARKSPKKLAVGLTLFALALLAGGYIVHSALTGQGRWHELARGLYHAVKGNAAQAAVLPTERADEAMVVYDDKLGDGWQDWSWGTRDLSSRGAGAFGQSRDFSDARRQPRVCTCTTTPLEPGVMGRCKHLCMGDTTARVCLVGEDLKFLPFVSAGQLSAP